MKSKNTLGFTIRGDKIYVQGSIDGVFKRYSTGLKATSENKKFIKANYRTELLKIHEEKTRPVKISNNFIEYSMMNLELNKSSRKENTVKEYLLIFKKHIAPSFKNYNLDDIKRYDLLTWQKKLVESGLKGKTINGIRSIFSFILEEAKKDELIEKNYFTLINREREIAQEVTPFSLDEVELILNTTSKSWAKNFFQIAFFTGMRIGEILVLKWEDINFFTKTINIKRSVRKGIVSSTKTHNSRTIDMLDIVEDALINQKRETYLQSSYIFLNNGTHFNDSGSIRKGVWINTLRLAGIDYRPLYQTRHTFASTMISKGEDILWVSKTLGHSNLSVTLTRYAKFIPNKKVSRASFLNDFNHKETAQTTAQNISTERKGA